MKPSLIIAALLAVLMGPSSTPAMATGQTSSPAPRTGPATDLKGAGAVAGTVADGSGAPLQAADVVVSWVGGGSSVVVARVRAGADGCFLVDALTAGAYRITAEVPGFASRTREVSVAAGATASVRLELPVAVAEGVTVRATRLAAVPEELRRMPGSIETIDADTLDAAHVFTINEALRKVTGINVRD